MTAPATVVGCIWTGQTNSCGGTPCAHASAAATPTDALAGAPDGAGQDEAGDEPAAPVAARGFRVQAFASGLDHPRWLYRLPNGDILVAETNAIVDYILDKHDSGRLRPVAGSPMRGVRCCLRRTGWWGIGTSC